MTTETVRRPLWILAAITALATALRVYRLDAQGAWFDEAFSIAVAGSDLRHLFAQLVDDVFHPPLHYLLLHWWFALTGYGPVQARVVALFFGALSVPALYRLAREFVSPGTSLAAALLLAVSQIGVYFSQEARPYSQAQFFGLLTALWFVQYLHRGSRKSLWLATAAATTLIYSHYYGVGILAALGIYWFWFRKTLPGGSVKQVAVGVVVMGMLFLPWLVALSGTDRDHTERHLAGTDRPPSLIAGLTSPFAALNRLNNGRLRSMEDAPHPAETAPGLILFTLPVLIAGFRVRDGSQKGLVLGLLLIGCPLALALLGSAGGLLYNYRYLSFGVPGYYLAVAISWENCFPALRWRMVWTGLAVLWCLVALRAVYFGVHKADYRTGLAPMASQLQPGDCTMRPHGGWHPQVHIGWLVYYRDLGIPPVITAPVEAARLQPCTRIWVVADRSLHTKHRPIPPEVLDRFEPAGHWVHASIELQLLTRIKEKGRP